MQYLKKLSGLCLTIGFCFVSNVQAAVEYPFKGEIDFTKKSGYLSIDAGDDAAIDVKVKQNNPRTFNVQMDVEKVHTSLFDISTQVNALLEYKKVSGQRFPEVHGNVISQYSLINQKPVRELSGDFIIKKKYIELGSVFFGNMRFQGDMGFRYPFKQDLTIVLSSTSLDQFLNFWNTDKNFDSEGLLSGEIKVKGDIERLNLRGNLASYDGFIKDLPFDNIQLNIAGIYPNMEISKSLLTQSGGLSYTFEGPIDLSQTKTFRKQIKELTMSPLVEAKGTEAEWTIKRIEDKDASAIELKYIKPDENRPGSLGDENQGGVLGIERSLKF